MITKRFKGRVVMVVRDMISSKQNHWFKDLIQGLTYIRGFSYEYSKEEDLKNNREAAVYADVNDIEGMFNIAYTSAKTILLDASISIAKLTDIEEFIYIIDKIIRSVPKYSGYVITDEKVDRELKIISLMIGTDSNNMDNFYLDTRYADDLINILNTVRNDITDMITTIDFSENEKILWGEIIELVELFKSLFNKEIFIKDFINKYLNYRNSIVADVENVEVDSEVTNVTYQLITLIGYLYHRFLGYFDLRYND